MHYNKVYIIMVNVMVTKMAKALAQISDIIFGLFITLVLCLMVWGCQPSKIKDYLKKDSTQQQLKDIGKDALDTTEKALKEEARDLLPNSIEDIAVDVIDKTFDKLSNELLEPTVFKEWMEDVVPCHNLTRQKPPIPTLKAGKP
jgi:hypothetical protein